MISNKKELDKCLSIELGINYKNIFQRLYNFIVPSSKTYIYVLRHTEFYKNSNSLFAKLLLPIYKIWLQRLSATTGISIPINTCAEGLTIYHHGSIVVNGACRIGKNLCICNNVNIGANNGGLEAPIIGDNVFIGPGAVLFGEIQIADGVYIGANSVVSKNIMTPNSVYAGAPAKFIRMDEITWWQKNKLKRNIK